MMSQTDPRTVRFYMPEGVRQQAARGELTFYNKLCNALRKADFDIHFCPDDLAERLKAKHRSSYSISLMKDPINARGVTIRRNYFYPFWNIQTVAERWKWPVANVQFDPALVTPNEARVFANYWRKALFNGAAGTTIRDGFVYAPLQGRLTTHRSFQFCSPIEMLKLILEHDKTRPLIATLHPKEDYSSAELSALERLSKQYPRLSVQTAEMTDLLARCDYVATQNSAVALYGYFFHKPAILFGQIDFHHIAANVHTLGAQKAITTAPDLKPNYDAYLCWFFKHMSINAEFPNAEDKIAAALRRAAWPV